MWSSLAIFELPPCILKEDFQETMLYDLDKYKVVEYDIAWPALSMT